MQKLLLFLLLFGFASITGAQGKFPPGFIIDDEGVRSSVLIQNRDWVDNPRSIQYREATDARALTATVEHIAGFGLDDGSLEYRRFTVGVDVSDQRPGSLTSSASAVIESRTVFLEVLVDGRADLFSLDIGGRRYFYYRLDSDEPRPLVNRRYRGKNNTILQDNTFRGELSRAVDCGLLNKRSTPLQYTRQELVRYFTEYNDCGGGGPGATFTRSTGRPIFSIAVRAGVQNGTVDAVVTGVRVFERRYEFAESPRLRLGAEAELRLPFANNHWAVYTGASIHGLRDRKTDEGSDKGFNLEYRVINVPLGVRRYVRMGENASLFVNGAFTIDMPLRSNFSEFNQLINMSYEFGRTSGFDAGLGLSIRQRYQVEAFYAFGRGITTSQVVKTDYVCYGLMASYRLKI